MFEKPFLIHFISEKRAAKNPKKEEAKTPAKAGQNTKKTRKTTENKEEAKQ